MHRKVRAAGLPCGGAKSVILLHPGLRRREALLALGRAIESLGGRYHAGPDMGIGPEDLRTIREATRHCADPDALGDLGEATARGVRAAMRAAARRALGRDSLAGVAVAVQGLGGVGLRLVEGLLREGGIVSGADVDPAAARGASAAAARGAQAGGGRRFRLVESEAILSEPCDVLAPCSRGGVLDAASIPGLRCRAVAGAANNVLASDADADRLASRGILAVPDFLANAGAVIRGARHALLGEADSTAAIDAIETCVAALLDRAAAAGRTPWALACEEADRPR